MKFRDLYWFLSNMYPAKVPMNIGGEDYIFDNAEAAFQAQKNPSLAKMFLGLNGFQAKSQGRKIPITTPNWDTARVDAMRKAVQAKFDNNADLMKMLQDTGVDYISEDNDWGDTFWGMSGGKGKNMLGNILMDIRDAAATVPSEPISAPTEVVQDPSIHNLGQDIITKVISGGQTGADILGLQLAQQAGIPTGGTMSYGPDGLPLIEADDGIDRNSFGFDFLDYPGNLRDAYVNRTNLNASNADGTIYFRGPEQGNGWFATKRAAEAAGKPFLDNPQNSNDIINWALKNNVKTLNVAGSRGSKMTDVVRNQETDVLNSLFDSLGKNVGSQTLEGDLLDTPDPLAMQQVNTLGVMGKGLASQIRDDLSPESYAKYQRISRTHSPEDLLGMTVPLPSVSHPDRTYLNVYGQSSIGNSGVHTDMDALETAFNKIADRYPAGTPISMPYGMGAGLGGGNWEDIEKLADEILGRKLLLTKWKK